MEPTASGTFGKTPLAHLVVYCLEKKLRGALIFRPEGSTDNAEADVITLVDGMPAKIKIADPVEHLGRILLEIGAIDDIAYNASLLDLGKGVSLHGQILLASGKIDAATLEKGLRLQIARKLGHLFSRPATTSYAYYEGADFLQRYGGPELFPIDPLPTLWTGVRANPSMPHVEATLVRIGEGALRVKADANLARFDLTRGERDVIERMKAQPTSAPQLLASAADPKGARLLLYALLLAKQIEVAPTDRSRAATLPRPAVDIPDRTRAATMPRPAVQVPASVPPPASNDPATAARRAEIKKRAAAIEKENYFQMLGLAADATADQAKDAYFALAKQWHPDRLPAELLDVKADVAKVFTFMAEAYQTLSDQERRLRYVEVAKGGGGTPADQAEVQRVIEAATSFQKAEFFVGKGQLAEAEPHAKKAFELDPIPDHVVVYTWIQANKPDRKESGRYDDLIAKLDAAVKETPKSERVRFYRGMVLKMAGRMGDAIKDFREVAEANPKHVDAAREVRLYQMRSERDRANKDEGSGSLLGRFVKKK